MWIMSFPWLRKPWLKKSREPESAQAWEHLLGRCSLSFCSMPDDRIIMFTEHPLLVLQNHTFICVSIRLISAQDLTSISNQRAYFCSYHYPHCLPEASTCKEQGLFMHEPSSWVMLMGLRY